MPGSEPANSLKISQLSLASTPIPLTSKFPVSIGGGLRVVTLNSLLNSVTGGTVTSVSAGVNIKLNPNPITSTGSISFNLPGLVIPYAGNKSPDDWVFCDGSSYPTNGVYTDLFAVVGYRFGGSGNSFQVPDLRGRMPASGYENGQVGTSGGSENVFLTSTQIAMRQHTHTGSTDFCLDVQYNGECCDAGDHRVRLIGAKSWGASGTQQTWSVSDSLPVNSPQSPSSSHNNMPPGLIVNFIIKL